MKAAILSLKKYHLYDKFSLVVDRQNGHLFEINIWLKSQILQTEDDVTRLQLQKSLSQNFANRAILFTVFISALVSY